MNWLDACAVVQVVGRLYHITEGNVLVGELAFQQDVSYHGAMTVHQVSGTASASSNATPVPPTLGETFDVSFDGQIQINSIGLDGSVGLVLTLSPEFGVQLNLSAEDYQRLRNGSKTR